MKIPVPPPSDVARPINCVGRWRATRRLGRFGRAVLRIAEEFATVGVAVVPLDSGGARVELGRSGIGDATTDAIRIGAWWTWWLTINVAVGLPRVVSRTQGGQAS